MANYSPNETSSQLFTEKMWLQGAIITGVGYGSVLTLFIFGFYLLVKGSTPSNRLRSISFLVYMFVQFMLATLFVAACSDFTQLSFVDNREYPGGPGQYEIDMFAVPIDELGTVSYVLSNWLADALLVWRCTVIYHSNSSWLCLIMALPGLGLLASIGTGIMYLIQVSSKSPFLSGTANFTVIYASISLALNVTLTLMIVTRLLLHRRRISKLLGDGQGREYTGIAAMLIESASLYAAFALFFIIPFGLQSSVQSIPFQALSQIQVIAPFLIIVRVSQGNAWSTDTSRELFSMKETPSNPVGLVKLKAMTFSASADIEGESGGRKSADVDGNMSHSIPV